VKMYLGCIKNNPAQSSVHQKGLAMRRFHSRARPCVGSLFVGSGVSFLLSAG
ncbi:hypothetical protein NDU88_006294, partial [Pleurodeles waltl]